jgi:hypothetical protein
MLRSDSVFSLSSDPANFYRRCKQDVRQSRKERKGKIVVIRWWVVMMIKGLLQTDAIPFANCLCRSIPWNSLQVRGANDEQCNVAEQGASILPPQGMDPRMHPYGPRMGPVSLSSWVCVRPSVRLSSLVCFPFVSSISNGFVLISFFSSRKKNRSPHVLEKLFTFLYTNVCQSRERGVCSSPNSSNCGPCSICISFLSENLLKKPLFFPVEEEACLTLEEAALRNPNRYVLLSL